MIVQPISDHAAYKKFYDLIEIIANLKDPLRSNFITALTAVNNNQPITDDSALRDIAGFSALNKMSKTMLDAVGKTNIKNLGVNKTEQAYAIKTAKELLEIILATAHSKQLDSTMFYPEELRLFNHFRNVLVLRTKQELTVEELASSEQFRIISADLFQGNTAYTEPFEILLSEFAEQRGRIISSVLTTNTPEELLSYYIKLNTISNQYIGDIKTLKNQASNDPILTPEVRTYLEQHIENSLENINAIATNPQLQMISDKLYDKLDDNKGFAVFDNLINILKNHPNKKLMSEFRACLRDFNNCAPVNDTQNLDQISKFKALQTVRGKLLDSLPILGVYTDKIQNRADPIIAALPADSKLDLKQIEQARELLEVILQTKNCDDHGLWHDNGQTNNNHRKFSPEEAALFNSLRTLVLETEENVDSIAIAKAYVDIHGILGGEKYTSEITALNFTLEHNKNAILQAQSTKELNICDDSLRALKMHITSGHFSQLRETALQDLVLTPEVRNKIFHEITKDIDKLSIGIDAALQSIKDNPMHTDLLDLTSRVELAERELINTTEETEWLRHTNDFHEGIQKLKDLAEKRNHTVSHETNQRSAIHDDQNKAFEAINLQMQTEETVKITLSLIKQIAINYGSTAKTTFDHFIKDHNSFTTSPEGLKIPTGSPEHLLQALDKKLVEIIQEPTETLKELHRITNEDTSLSHEKQTEISDAIRRTQIRLTEINETLKQEVSKYIETLISEKRAHKAADASRKKDHGAIYSAEQTARDSIQAELDKAYALIIAQEQNALKQKQQKGMIDDEKTKRNTLNDEMFTELQSIHDTATREKATIRQAETARHAAAEQEATRREQEADLERRLAALQIQPDPIPENVHHQDVELEIFRHTAAERNIEAERHMAEQVEAERHAAALEAAARNAAAEQARITAEERERMLAADHAERLRLAAIDFEAGRPPAEKLIPLLEEIKTQHPGDFNTNRVHSMRINALLQEHLPTVIAAPETTREQKLEIASYVNNMTKVNIIDQFGEDIKNNVIVPLLTKRLSQYKG